MPNQRSVPENYPIGIEYDELYTIGTHDDLKRWIEERSQDHRRRLKERDGIKPEFDIDSVGGLFLSQPTISYDQDTSEFRQAGTGPNFFGNTCSLATCRWMHRGHDTGNGGWNFEQFFTEHPSNSNRLLPKQPTLLIFAAGSQRLLGRSRRPVAGIAFVTDAFWTMEAYARFLTENGSERAINHRLTHNTKSKDHTKAVEFGDCHADRDAVVDEPPEGHDHHQGTESTCGCGGNKRVLPHRDTAADHVKCLSMPGYWHAYSDTPAFELVNIGDRGAKYVSEERLDSCLRPFGMT